MQFVIFLTAIYCHRNKTPSLDANKIVEHWRQLLLASSALNIRFKVISADGDAKARKAFIDCATSEVAKQKIPIECDLL